MTKLKSYALVVLFSLTVSAAAILAQTPATNGNAKPPEQELRDFYYRGDSELAVYNGKELAEKPNAGLETRGWYFVQAANTFLGSSQPLAPMLEEMKKTAPDSAWTLLARASAAAAEEALVLCQKAIAAASDNEDIYLLCVDTLASKIEPIKEKDFAAFIAPYRDKIEATDRGLVTLADAVLKIGRNSPKAREQALPLYDRALKLNPQNERALLGKGRNAFLILKRYHEFNELIEPAILSGSQSSSLHFNYWTNLSKTGISKEEVEKRIESSAARLLEKTFPAPGNLPIILSSLRGQSEETANKLGDMIIARYPDTVAARGVMFERLIAKNVPYSKGIEMPKEARKQIAGEAIAFLKIEKNKNWSSEPATGFLVNLLVNKPAGEVDAEQLFAAAQVANVTSAAPLANEALKQKVRVQEIKQLAEKSIDELLRQQQAKRKWQLEKYAAREMTMLWMNLSKWYDVLGYALLLSGQLDESAAKLAVAEQFATPNDINIPLHLAKLYETKKDFEKAETYLNKALAMNYFGEGRHPALEAFADFYLAKNGKKDGMEKYLTAVYERERARRKPLILAQRIKDAESHPAFNLKTLDGKPISSADLKGKIVVINFWATWCAPCVKEMPEFEKLYKKYKNDPQVAILAISADETPDLPAAFMARKKYTFPVAFQGDYGTKASIGAYPTTWFLDQEGNIAFSKVGGTVELEEEFSWRIEALRKSPPTAAMTSTTNK